LQCSCTAATAIDIDRPCRVRVRGAIELQGVGRGPDCAISFSELPPGAYTVDARRGSATGSTTVEVGTGGRASCQIPLKAHVSVTARVVDASGVAVPGLLALLLDNTSTAEIAAQLLLGEPRRTDADGRVTWMAAPGASTLAILSSDGQRVLHVRSFVIEGALDLGTIIVNR
jgi:hypothetical protein